MRTSRPGRFRHRKHSCDSRSPQRIGLCALTMRCLLASVALIAFNSGTKAQYENASDLVAAAYPDQITAIRNGTIFWRDDTTSQFDDGSGPKTFQNWLARPDVEDMLLQPYPAGHAIGPPKPNSDPGRARNTAFFTKIYGDCRKGEVTPNLVDVVWLPKHDGRRLKVTSVNGVARRLAAVSHALDALPHSFKSYLTPPAGTYNCREIAGTNRLSAHSYGIAIDIATSHADYWRWSKPGPDGEPVWRNRIPFEIVKIFEAHGFIWGGKWHHYDTMHFEYRPELLPPTAPLQ